MIQIYLGEDAIYSPHGMADARTWFDPTTWMMDDTPLVLSSLVKLRQSTGSRPPEVTSRSHVILGHTNIFQQSKIAIENPSFTSMIFPQKISMEHFPVPRLIRLEVHVAIPSFQSPTKNMLSRPAVCIYIYIYICVCIYIYMYMYIYICM